VIAIGASAGGIEALRAVVPALPHDLGAAVLIVQHLAPRHESLLHSILARHARLPVRQAVHGDVITAGIVYVAPPDMHLLVASGLIELSHSRLVHFSRPSVDLLFESVAGEYGSRAIGVILTGSGADGATGIRAIKRMGGVTIVEDPETAAHPGMPHAALATGSVDVVLPLLEIAGRLVELMQRAGDERKRTR
jgi:two-component system chemotaxis response regulator CheB